MTAAHIKPDTNHVQHAARGLCHRCYAHARNRGHLRRHQRLRGHLHIPFVRDTQDGWRDDAACLGTDAEPFFADQPDEDAHAKAICARCPVRQSCLDWALATHEHGVWGGLTRREREDMQHEAVS